MSCIIGYKDKTNVWIGADSVAYKNETDIRIFSEPKVFRHEKILCGTCGTIRFRQILEQVICKQKLKWGDSISRWLIGNFVPNLISELEKQKNLEMKDGEARGWPFLLGIQGGLFQIHYDFSVTQTDYPYDAIGSGEQYALGALTAMRDIIQTPKEKIRWALYICNQFCPSVKEPFHIISDEE